MWRKNLKMILKFDFQLISVMILKAQKFVSIQIKLKENRFSPTAEKLKMFVLQVLAWKTCVSSLRRFPQKFFYCQEKHFRKKFLSDFISLSSQAKFLDEKISKTYDNRRAKKKCSECFLSLIIIVCVIAS